MVQIRVNTINNF